MTDYDRFARLYRNSARLLNEEKSDLSNLSVEVWNEVKSNSELRAKYIALHQQDLLEILPIEEIQDKDRFIQSVSANPYTAALSPPTEEYLNQMKLYMVRDYQAGFGIKPDGDIVLVHNSDPHRIKGLGEVLMKAAIEAGGTKLDHFDIPRLNQLYSKFGFKEYERSPYNAKYDEDGAVFNACGEVDVIYRRL